MDFVLRASKNKSATRIVDLERVMAIDARNLATPHINKSVRGWLLNVTPR